MADRFQTRLSTAVASRVHFKKAGPVLGLGFKGGSLSINKNEVFVNVDVLGTGLSQRTMVSRAAFDGMVDGGARGPLSPECQEALAACKAHSTDGASLEVGAEITMAGFITYRYADGNDPITDPVIIEGISQLPELGVALKILKHEQERVWDDVCMEMVDMNRDFIDLYRLTPPVISGNIFASAGAPGTVVARRVVSSEDVLHKEALSAFLSHDAAQTGRMVKDWIESIALPVELSVQVECAGGLVSIDVDLPSIDALPTRGMKKLPGSQLKSYEKAADEVRLDYATCVLGMAYFLASNVLNLNADIHRVLVSGFGVSGCLYSALFPREQMEGARIADPLRSLGEFTHRMKLSGGYDFTPVEPCATADFSRQ